MSSILNVKSHAQSPECNSKLSATPTISSLGTVSPHPISFHPHFPVLVSPRVTLLFSSNSGGENANWNYKAKKMVRESFVFEIKTQSWRAFSSLSPFHRLIFHLTVDVNPRCCCRWLQRGDARLERLQLFFHFQSRPPLSAASLLSLLYRWKSFFRAPKRKSKNMKLIFCSLLVLYYATCASSIH